MGAVEKPVKIIMDGVVTKFTFWCCFDCVHEEPFTVKVVFLMVRSCRSVAHGRGDVWVKANTCFSESNVVV